MVKTGKKFLSAKKEFEGKFDLSLEEAINLVKSNSSAKFDETIDIAINLGVDPKHADQMVRGVCALPHGNGKDVRVAVFAKGEKAEEAKKAGADLVGAEDLMETIQGGAIDFDRCIATPDMMAIVGRLGKVLGPRNLMPNPKVGTVTVDVEKAVKSAKSALGNARKTANFAEVIGFPRIPQPRMNTCVRSCQGSGSVGQCYFRPSRFPVRSRRVPAGVVLERK